MYQNFTKHGRFYKQNNQLPTKSYDELEDNSNMWALKMKLQVSWLKGEFGGHTCNII